MLAICQSRNPGLSSAEANSVATASGRIGLPEVNAHRGGDDREIGFRNLDQAGAKRKSPFALVLDEGEIVQQWLNRNLDAGAVGDIAPEGNEVVRHAMLID